MNLLNNITFQNPELFFQLALQNPNAEFIWYGEGTLRRTYQENNRWRLGQRSCLCQAPQHSPQHLQIQPNV